MLNIILGQGLSSAKVLELGLKPTKKIYGLAEPGPVWRYYETEDEWVLLEEAGPDLFIVRAKGNKPYSSTKLEM